MGVKFTGGISVPQGAIDVSSINENADPLFNNVVLLTGFNGNFNDESNSNHSPTTVGSVTTSTSNAYFSGNQVGQFPGTGTSSDYVEYPISSDFRLEMTEDWTIELFLRCTDTTTNAYRSPIWFWDGSFLTIDPGQAPTARGFGLAMNRAGLNTQLNFRYISDDTVRYTIAGPNLVLNTWYYAAIVNDGATRTASYYIDGSLQGTGVGNTTGLGSDMVCSIGRVKTEFTSQSDIDWPGQIEEVRVTRAKRTISGIPTEPFPRT